MLAAGPQLPPPGVEPPQPIITIVHHVQGPQYRSLSPILPAELLPRAHTVPVLEPVNFYPRTGRVPRTRRARQGPYLDCSEPLATKRPSADVPAHTLAPFERRLQNLRAERRPASQTRYCKFFIRRSISFAYFFVLSHLYMIGQALPPLIWVVEVVAFLVRGITLARDQR
jgi:hypothetical protein